MNDTLSKTTIKMSALQRTASVPTANDKQIIHDYLLTQFSISQQVFDPELLKNGTEEEQKQQLQFWANGPSSIFIHWIPDELATQEAASVFFRSFGKISRVDIVPNTNPSKKFPGNMAFIHFESWHNPAFPKRFVLAYPKHVDMEFYATNRYGTKKLYTLRAHVNTRPVAQAEFNAPQMIDMMNNLETRVKAELEAVKAELEQTRQEKQDLQTRLALTEQSLWQSQQLINYQHQLLSSNNEHVIDVRYDNIV
jgi:hypothetical protein